MNHIANGQPASPPVRMYWEDLRPQGAPGPGWSEQLQPGVCALVDESGDAAAHWLGALTGYALPAQGRVVCGPLTNPPDSPLDSAAYQAQVCWHNPRLPLASTEREITAQQWVQRMAQRWPSWDDSAWEAHCTGFALQPHMDKPLWHLSTGSLRKLGMAAALASGARLTVIEEPVAALDSSSIRYLSQALDALGEALAGAATPRWVLVAHWEPLPGVMWDEVLAPPALTAA